MASARPIGLGILGCGNWTRTVHLPNLALLPEFEVRALYSRTRPTLDRARGILDGQARGCQDVSTVLADESVEAVIVCTPNHTHEELALACLRAGKHVLCEKPASFTSAGMARLARAHQEAGTVFQVDLELRYSDVIQQMLRLIRAGQIGRPKLIQCLLMRDWGSFRSWRGDPALSGGMALELACHYLDLFNALADAPPTRVYCTGGHAMGAPMPDYLSCVVEYENEVRADLSLTVIAAARNEIRLHVIGSEGRLEGEIIGGSVSVWRRHTREPEDYSPKRAEDYAFHGFPGALEGLAHFGRCIREGAEPVGDMEVARRATLVSAAAEQSMQTGAVITL